MEPMKIEKIVYTGTNGEIVGICPYCGKFINLNFNPKFCGCCGTPVRWNTEYIKQKRR